MRIVSLLPSATEIVYALGLEDHLVGVTFECDEPAERANGQDRGGRRPGHQRDDPGRDRRVRPRPRWRPVRTSTPCTQTPGRSCAGSDRQPGPVPGLRPALRPGPGRAGLPGVPLRRPGTGPAEPGRRPGVDPGRGRPRRCPVAGRGRWSPVCGRVSTPWPRVSPACPGRGWRSSSGSIRRSRPGTGCRIWSWRQAGIRSRPSLGARSEQTTWDEIRASGPDLVIVAPCGYHLDGAAGSGAAWCAAHVPDVPLWAIDADGIVVRPGPRLVTGVEAIASVLHPGAVPEPPAGSVARVS